jgi:hypothetical protein
MLGTGLLLFRYLHAHRGLGRGRAAAIALLAIVTPGFVFLATSTVMSECAFTCALMASAVAIERAARAQPAYTVRDIVLAGALTTAAWLIRASGIALVAAAASFLFWKRGWRASAGFLVVCGICYAPWWIYSATHQPAEADRFAHGGDIVRYYHSPLVSRGAEPPMRTGDLRRRITTNLVNVFGRDMGAAIFPAGYRGEEESGLEVFFLSSGAARAGSMGNGAAFMVLSGVVGIFVLIGAVTMARRGIGVAEFFCVVTVGMLVLVSSHTFRYVLPIVPFLLGYFLVGVEAAVARARAGAGLPAFRVAAGCLLFFVFAEHGRFIWLKALGPTPLWIEDGREVRAVTDFVRRQLPTEAPVVSTNPAFVYLTTGHRAVAYVDPHERWEQWRAAGVRYIVALHDVPLPGRSLDYQVIFESPRAGFWVLELPSR